MAATSALGLAQCTERLQKERHKEIERRQTPTHPRKDPTRAGGRPSRKAVGRLERLKTRNLDADAVGGHSAVPRRMRLGRGRERKATQVRRGPAVATVRGQEAPFFLPLVIIFPQFSSGAATGATDSSYIIIFPHIYSLQFSAGPVGSRLCRFRMYLNILKNSIRRLPR